MKIFLINLEHRVDRLDFVKKQLEQHNLLFERIDAVNGINLSFDDQNVIDVEKFTLLQKKKPVKGELGCAMSHRKVWKKMIDEKIDYALILEDDVKFDKNLKSFLEEKELYRDFDFINLSSKAPYMVKVEELNVLKKKKITKKADSTSLDDKKLWKSLEWNQNWKIQNILEIKKNIFLCEATICPALTSGYIISKKAAQSFLDTSQGMYFPIDYIWRYAGGYLKQGFVVNPIIIQSMNDSNISGRDIPYKLTFKQKLKKFLIKRQINERKKDLKRMYQR